MTEKEAAALLDKETRERLRPLAFNLMCAYVGHMSGVRPEAIAKRPYGELGDYWFLLAMQVQRDMLKGR